MSDAMGNTQYETLLQRLHQASRLIAIAKDEADITQALIDFVSTDVHVARLLLFTDFVDGGPTHVEMREGWTVDDRPVQPYGTRLPLADYPIRNFMDPDAVAICRDVESDERLNETARTMMALSGVGSFVAVPLTVGQNWLGALFVGRNSSSIYAEELIYAWWTLASQSAAAMEQMRSRTERERLLNDLERHALQLQTAAEVSHAASSILDPEELIVRVVNLVRDRFGLYYTGLFLVDQTGEWTNEPGRWAVLRAGTGQAGQQMLAQGHKIEIGDDSMIGWCVANAQARIASDVGTDAVHSANPLLPKTRSEMALPLLSRGQVIGAMTIHSTQQDAFSEADVSVLQTLADQVANAIGNARLFESAQRAHQDQQRRSEKLRALHDLYLELIEEQHDLYTVFDILGQRAMSLMETDGAGVWLWQSEDQELELVFTHQVGEADLTGRRLKPGQGMTGRAFVEKKTQVIGNYQTWEGRPSSFDDVPFHSAIVVPLIWQNQAFGALALSRSQQSRPFATDEQHLTELLAAQAATIIQNTRLFQQAQQRTARLEWLALMEATLSQATSEEEILTAISFGVELEYPVDRIVFQYLDTDQDGEPKTLRTVAAWHDGLIVPDDPELGQDYAIQDLRFSRLWLSDPEHTVFVSDIDTDPRADELIREQAAQLGFRAMAFMPLYSGNRWQGLVTFFWPQSHTFSTEERYHLQELSKPASALVASRRAYLTQQQARHDSERRATQLQVATQVSRAVNSILDPGELIQQVVDLLRQGFDLYYAGLFLVDQRGEWTGEPGRWAVLRAGTGQAGQQMVAQGHKLEVGGNSMIGYCVANAQPRIAFDVGEEAIRFDNPFLPETRTEMALPLIIQGQAIGAMTIQSQQEAAFSDEDIAVLQTVADQVSTALENARLFEEQQQTSALLSERLKDLNCLNDIGRKIDETPPIPEFLEWVAERIPKTMQHPNLCRVSIEYAGQVFGAAEAVDLPQHIVGSLHTGEAQLGRIVVAYTEPHDFTDEESALLGDIVRRVSGYIENRRLFEQTQQALAESEALYQATQAISEVPELEPLVERLAEVARRLTNAEYSVVLTLDPQTGAIEHFKTAGVDLDEYPIVHLPEGKGVLNALLRGKTIRTADIHAHPDAQGLPEWHFPLQSILGMPLLYQEQTRGILIVGNSVSTKPFDEADENTLGTFAAQAAITIENRRLFEQTERALAEVESTHRRYLREQWAEMLSAGSDRVWGYVDGPEGLIATDEVWTPEIERAVTTGAITTVTEEPAITESETNAGTRNALALPIRVREQTIGVLDFYDEERIWTEEDKALVQALADQLALALENARLFEQTQRRASREQLTSQIVGKIRAAGDVHSILETAAGELARALGVSRAAVRLGNPTDGHPPTGDQDIESQLIEKKDATQFER